MHTRMTEDFDQHGSGDGDLDLHGSGVESVGEGARETSQSIPLLLYTIYKLIILARGNKWGNIVYNYIFRSRAFWRRAPWSPLF